LILATAALVILVGIPQAHRIAGAQKAPEALSSARRLRLFRL
jgi:hypothetical protein